MISRSAGSIRAIFSAVKYGFSAARYGVCSGGSRWSGGRRPVKASFGTTFWTDVVKFGSRQRGDDVVVPRQRPEAVVGLAVRDRAALAQLRELGVEARERLRRERVEVDSPRQHPDVLRLDVQPRLAFPARAGACRRSRPGACARRRARRARGSRRGTRRRAPRPASGSATTARPRASLVRSGRQTATPRRPAATPSAAMPVTGPRSVSIVALAPSTAPIRPCSSFDVPTKSAT